MSYRLNLSAASQASQRTEAASYNEKYKLDANFGLDNEKYKRETVFVPFIVDLANSAMKGTNVKPCLYLSSWI